MRSDMEEIAMYFNFFSFWNSNEMLLAISKIHNRFIYLFIYLLIWISVSVYTYLN